MNVKDKNNLITAIKRIRNPYPKDVFAWDSRESCDFTRGQFNQFIFQVVENTKEDMIKLLEAKDV